MVIIITGDIGIGKTTVCEKVIEIVRKRHFSVVVSSDVLPDCNGSFVLEHLLQDSPETQRILYSSRSKSTVGWDRIMACKPYAVIPKPDIDRQLRRSVRMAVKKYDKQSGARSY